MVKIWEVQPGDQLQCYMRLGLAISVTVRGDGTPYYRVPPKAHTAKSTDLTRFLGFVVRNNVSTHVLTMQVSAFNSIGNPTSDTSMQVDVHYSALKRVRRYSPYSIIPTQRIPGDRSGRGTRRPGSIAGFGATDRKPYRTLEEISLV